MRIILSILLAFSFFSLHAEPMSSAEHEMKLRHMAKKRKAKRWRYWRAYGPRGFHAPVPHIDMPVPPPNFPAINPFQIPFSPEAMPFIVAGVIAGGIISIAVADQKRLRRGHREAVKTSGYQEPEILPQNPLPKRQIGREELAAEYEAWKKQRKKTDYLAEN